MKRSLNAMKKMSNLLAPLALILAMLVLGGTAQAQNSSSTNTEAPQPVVGGAVPGGTLGTSSDAELWRMIRSGGAGTVAMPSANAGVLIQAPGAVQGNPVFGNYISSGQLWRDFKNGPLQTYGSYALGAIIAILIVFFAVRGRIKIDHGPAGVTIERFNLLERVGHWLTALSFVVLGLTGLALMYGKAVLIPVIGKEAFAWIALGGKYLHHGFAFSFMLGLVLIFLLWVRHNIPGLIDLKWAAMGGGVLVKGVHPPAKKFNGGQKVIFWATIIGGASLAVSGWALLFPFEYPMFAKTFQVVNMLGFSFPTELSPVQEQQYAQLWHTMVALGMIVIIIAHIYIGSIGMEGAFDAMSSGKVDLNWAKEHHSLWVEEVEQKQAGKLPAE